MSHQETLAALKSQLLTLKTQYVSTRKQQQHFLQTVLETEPKDGEPNEWDECKRINPFYDGKIQTENAYQRIVSILGASAKNELLMEAYQAAKNAIFIENIPAEGNTVVSLLTYFKDCAGSTHTKKYAGNDMTGNFNIFLTVQGHDNIMVVWYVYNRLIISKKGVFVAPNTSSSQPSGKILKVPISKPIDLYVTEVWLVNAEDNKVIASQKIGEIPTKGKEYTWDEVELPVCTLRHMLHRYSFDTEERVFLLDKPIKYQVFIQIMEGEKQGIKTATFDLSHEYEGVTFSIPRPQIKHDITVKATSNAIINYFIDGEGDERSLAAPYSLNGCLATYRDLAGRPAKQYRFGLKVEEGVQPVPGSVVTVNKTSRTGYVNFMIDFSGIQAGSFNMPEWVIFVGNLISKLRGKYLEISFGLLKQGLENLVLAVEDGDNSAIENIKSAVDIIDSGKGVLEGATTSFIFMTQFAGCIPVIGAAVGASKLLLSFLDNSKKDEYVKNVKGVLAQLDSIHTQIGNEIDKLETDNTQDKLGKVLAKLADPCIPQSFLRAMIVNEFLVIQNSLERSPYSILGLSKK